jgi:hypothetical protein
MGIDRAERPPYFEDVAFIVPPSRLVNRKICRAYRDQAQGFTVTADLGDPVSRVVKNFFKNGAQGARPLFGR